MIFSVKQETVMKEVLAIDCEGSKLFWNALESECKTYYASTVETGLSMMSESIGLVFLCLQLPDMNGMEALSLMKKEYPSTAIIVTTSVGTEETCIEAFRKGARDYMKKPLNTDEILLRIRTLLKARDVSQKRQHVSLSMETVREEHFPDIPAHLLNGVLKVRDFIAQNYAESLTLEAACKMASMSRTYFCHFFKSVTGHSLNSYQHAVKIRRANELLSDKKLSIMDVALKLGYCDSNYFSTIYKKVTGTSPGQRHVLNTSPTSH
ncbi:MAG: DNA-binding response regulator [Nitrospiraceae bacterium]|nr:MAG: DNA-binding response regulator [Nitrospiraceae bacterium]